MKRIKVNFDLIKIIISIVLYGASYLFTNNLKLVLLMLSYVIISYELYIASFKKILKKDFFDENFLMIIATIGAFFIKKYEESVMVILLFQIGEYLSDLAVDNSRKRITDLLDLKVEKLHLKKGENYEDIDIKEARLGDVFIVKPGERIALDGRVIEGRSMVDTSAITGEVVPIRAEKESCVLSGFINQDSMLVVEATSVYETSVATKIITSLENSTEKKSETEKFITRFAKIYTPIVVLIAVLLTLIPTLMGYRFDTYLYRSLIFLVTSCPCALVLSVPLGYFCGIGRMSHDKILVKGSNELDLLSKLDIIAFDKTGTITEGVYEVVEVCSKNEDNDELLRLASYAEYYSIHPIARSILNKYNKKIDESKITDFKEISGKGVTLKYDKKRLVVGNDKLMQQEKISYEKVKKTGTIIYIAKENTFLGYIVISDKIKESAKHLVANLKEVGIKDFWVLSGDKEESVKSVCQSISITSYKAELLPTEKVEVMKDLRKRGITAFVGDGINDAPVLMVSDLGISMGLHGSDAAIDASSVVLMQDDLSNISKAIKISHFTTSIVRENIIFALVTKFAILLLALFGYTTIFLAVFADVGVTLLTILNTIRIMIHKIK